MSVAQVVRRNASFGGRVPPILGGLMIATLILSVLSTATVIRLGFPWVAQYGTLVPESALHGQVWRLVTWMFIAQSPFGLLFGCLALVWFGRDLVEHFGSGGFLWRYLVGGAIAGLLTTLVTWPFGQGGAAYVGAEAVTFCGVIVLWALYWPDRTINFYLVLPLRGWTLVGVTLLLTTLFGLYGTLWAMVPQYAAALVAVVYAYRKRLLGWARLPRGRTRRPPTDFQVWDEEKQRFRPPKWMN